MQDAVALQLRALAGHHGGPHQILGEVRRGGDADQGGDAVRPGQCHQKGDPAAHAAAGQQQRPRSQAINQQQGVVGPAADGAVREGAAAGAMAGVVQPQARQAVRGAECLGLERLRPLHVAAIARQEHRIRPAPGRVDPGQLHAVAPVGPARLLPGLLHHVFPCMGAPR